MVVLAAWFRLKYPHHSLGALASSAPVLYFEDITPQDGYYKVVTENFKVTKFEGFGYSLKVYFFKIF